MKKGKITKIFLEQLQELPIIQVACKKAGISRTTAYRWRSEDEEFRKAWDEAIDSGVLMLNDMAEAQLVSAIKDRDMRAITLWLRSNHERYGAKVEITGHVKMERKLNSEQKAVVMRALKMAGLATDDLNGYEE